MRLFGKQPGDEAQPRPSPWPASTDAIAGDANASTIGEPFCGGGMMGHYLWFWLDAPQGDDASRVTDCTLGQMPGTGSPTLGLGAVMAGVQYLQRAADRDRARQTVLSIWRRLEDDWSAFNAELPLSSRDPEDGHGGSTVVQSRVLVLSNESLYGDPGSGITGLVVMDPSLDALTPDAADLFLERTFVYLSAWAGGIIGEDFMHSIVFGKLLFSEIDSQLAADFADELAD
jgi:hypothetical protein